MGYVFLALPFPVVSSELSPAGSHLSSSAVRQTWHSLPAETVSVLSRDKTLLYMYLCICRNMRFIFFTTAWHSSLKFSLWSAAVSRFFWFTDLFVHRAAPHSGICHLYFGHFFVKLLFFFSWFFFGGGHISNIWSHVKPVPSTTEGARPLLLSLNATGSFASPSPAPLASLPKTLSNHRAAAASCRALLDQNSPFDNELITGTFRVTFSSPFCAHHAVDLSRPHTRCACLWALCGRRRDQTCICFCQRDLSPCHIRK